MPEAFILAPAASACPVCDSGTGEQVRAGIIDGQFGANLLATLLPFAVVLGVAAVVHSGWAWRKNPADRKEKEEARGGN